MMPNGAKTFHKGNRQNFESHGFSQRLVFAPSMFSCLLNPLILSVFMFVVFFFGNFFPFPTNFSIFQ